MLNKESRRYFKRALVMSGSVYSIFALTETNHLKKMQQCAHTKDVNQIIEYVQTSDYKDIVQCYFKDDWKETLKGEWIPTIEAPGTINGFITESPDEIYASSNAPVIDTLFSFTSQVFLFRSCPTRVTPLVSITFNFLGTSSILPRIAFKFGPVDYCKWLFLDYFAVRQLQ